MKKKALALILSLTMLVSSIVPGLMVSANGTTTSDITTIEEVETPLSSEPDKGTQTPETTEPTVPGEGETTEPTVPGEGETTEPTVPGEGGTTEPTVPGEGGTTEPTVPGEGGTTEPTDPENPAIDAEAIYNCFMACTTIEEIEALKVQISDEEWAALSDDQKAAIEEHIASLKGKDETDTSAEELYNRFMACTTIEEIEALKAQLTEENWAKLSEEQKAAIEAHIAELEQAQQPDEEQIMAAVMALVAEDVPDEKVSIDNKWFSFEGVPEDQKPASFTIYEGELKAGNLPTIEGYEFEKATYNGTEVLSVGQVTYDGKTYVYYETAASEGSPVRLVLPEGKTIVLNYKKTAVDITYTVTVDSQPQNPQDDGSISVSGISYGQTTESTVTIIPATNPKTVFPGNGYTFEVTIPRGYQATVTANSETLAPKLGESPSYTLQNNTVVKTEGTDYLTHALYTVENTQEAQTVNVALTKDNTHNFNADLIRQTIYFGGGDRVSSSNINGGTWEGNFTGDTVSWVFETEKQYATWLQGKPNPKWLLNVLQINGADLIIPFTDNQTKITELPSGTIISITRSRHDANELEGRYAWYKYTITATNCHEDLVVTGGNLNGTTHNEYMPYEFIGVDTFEYQTNNRWVEAKISQPFSANTVDRTQFRFKLKPGYGEPKFDINGAQFNATFNEEDQYYYVQFDVPDTFPALITIDAEEVLMKVAYQAGQSADGQTINADNMPTDDKTYSLSGEHEILIPTNIPVDKDNKYVFLGWANGTHDGTIAELYQPGDKVELADLKGSTDTVTFTAKWIDAAQAEKINITVEIWDIDNKANKIDELKNIQVPKGTSVVLQLEAQPIKDWTNEHKEYKVDKDNPENQKVYTPAEIAANPTIKLYVKEKEATIKYEVVGPDGVTGFGAVAPESETVKVKTGTAQGATPTAGTGYRFVGWYADKECTEAVNEEWVNKDTNELTPQNTGDMWVENPKDDEKENVITYYAKFEVGYADLTITAGSVDNTYGDQCFIYIIQGTDDQTNSINMKVAVPAGESRTITHLPIGTYKVTEEGKWSWRYNNKNDTSEEITLQAENTNEVPFNEHTLTNSKWLSGCSHNIDAVKSFFGGLLSMMK